MRCWTWLNKKSQNRQTTGFEPLCHIDITIILLCCNNSITHRLFFRLYKSINRINKCVGFHASYVAGMIGRQRENFKPSLKAEGKKNKSLTLHVHGWLSSWLKGITRFHLQTIRLKGLSSPDVSSPGSFSLGAFNYRAFTSRGFHLYTYNWALLSTFLHLSSEVHLHT